MAPSGCINGLKSKSCAILGAQWGDEGKGKLADMLAKHYDLVGRFNGGNNAGHTIVVEGKKCAFHILPCGLIYEHTLNYLGNGVVVNLDAVFEELKPLREGGIKNVDQRLKISNRAHLLFEFHEKADVIMEEWKGEGKLGTTKKGIGPAYMTRAMRTGIRVGEILNWDSFEKKYRELRATMEKMFNFKSENDDELAKLKGYREILIQNGNIVDGAFEVNKALNEGKRVIVEGANAAMLDLDLGSYPFVTSSNTTSGNVATGLGLPASRVECVIGVVKAYTTRVGSGPFPTELCFDTHPVGIHLQTVGREIGVTTKRKRRCGWLDCVLLQYSNMINGYSSVNLTKLDILDELEEVKICVQYKSKSTGNILPLGCFPATLEDLGDVEPIYETFPGWKQDISKVKAYSDLPANAKKYIEAIEKFGGVVVSWVGVGPDRDQMFLKQ